MKSFTRKSFQIVIATILAGALTVSFASANPAFRKAKGKYNGNLSGTASVAGFGTLPFPATASTLKLPNGKGKVVINITGAGTVKGKVTKAKVRQGGKKVIQTGKAKVPASTTGGLGAISGPFKAVVKLGGGKPTVRATTTLSIAGGSVKGKFTGSQ